MNTQTINTELVLALRKCLRFVPREYPRTYAFAMRALIDADARVVEEQRVKNIIEAEAKRPVPSYRSGEGHLPAAPPTKNCTCDTCTRYRRSTLNFYKD